MKQSLALNVTRLLKKAAGGESRQALAKRIGVGDGTLGRIVYGTANPNLETIVQLAAFFRVKPWELLMPADVATTAPAPQPAMQTELLVDALRGVAELQASTGLRLDAKTHAMVTSVLYRQLERNVGIEDAKAVVADLLSAMRTANEEQSNRT